MLRILAVGPHPDDVEFGCAPVLIQEVKKGNQVKILVLSKGEAASAGSPKEREREAREAARIIGAEIDFLDMGGDCHMRHSPESGFAIAREIRRFRPEVVLAPHPDENQHPDHVAVGRSVRDAARLARYGGLANLKDLDVHPIDQLYFYNITQAAGPRPDIVIDISEVVTQWEAAVRCHASQMKTKGYLDLVKARAHFLGASLGVPAAIGLWVNDPVRVRALSDLTLSSRNF